MSCPDSNPPISDSNSASDSVQDISDGDLFILDHFTHSFEDPSIRTSDSKSEMVALRNVVFGGFPIKGQVFYASRISVGLVNLKPISLGHVLVCTRRMEPRFTKLTEEEVKDLWLSAHAAGKILEKAYKCTSLTYAIQDGKEAGQSVPHVHIHVIPRFPNDFEPKDTIYEILNSPEYSIKRAQQEFLDANSISDLRRPEWKRPDENLLSKLSLGQRVDVDTRSESEDPAERYDRSVKPKIMRGNLKVDAGEERKPRSLLDMTREARWLNSFADIVTY